MRGIAIRTRVLALVSGLAVIVAIGLASSLWGGNDTSSPNLAPQSARAVLARLNITTEPGDRAFQIPSSSMEPTLHCAQPGSECLAAANDRILTRPYSNRRPRRGDIIVFNTPSAAFTRCGAGGRFDKRVVALPGETFEERNGFVYINNVRISEPYIRPLRRDARTIAPVKIGKGQYFVLGDNRSASCDSRAWGTVPWGNIIGRAIAIYWPPARARRL